MRRRGRTPLRKQSGAALLAMAAVLVLGTAWLSVSILGNVQSQSIALRAKDGKTLLEAKTALIAYAAQQAYEFTENSPGRLPCPEDPSYMTDTDAENDGLAAATCTLPAVGRLPWRTLGIAPLRDSSGELLWYAVSSGWAIPPSASPAAVAINSNTVGQITVDGQVPATATPSNTVAALIIAPGPPLTLAPTGAQQAAGCVARTQVRGTLPPDLRNYLECENATSPANATFVTSVTGNATNSVFNDLVVAVTPAEILDRVEPVVSARIERDVVPQFRSYAQDTIDGWALSSSQPVYPFAAPFANPSTSSWKGSAGTYQGLMPLTRSQGCTPGTELDCDNAHVQWNTGSITITKVSGTPTLVSTDCTASTASQISCDVTYQRTGCGFFSSCTTGTLAISLSSAALNVGMGFKKRPSSVPAPTVVSSSWSSPSTPTKASLTLGSTGSVPLAYGGTLASYTCPAWSFGSCTVTRTVRVTLPTFGDHWALAPSTSDAWWWFKNSGWHHLVYYAVAPNHSPSGATHACTTGVDCLTVTNLSPAGGQRAILILAGRTLTGNARPSGTLAEYLDPVGITGIDAAINRDGDTAFYKAGANAAMNDRFVTLDSN